MNRKEFIDAAKFTLEIGGGIYTFIGVLCSRVKMPYADEEWKDLFVKMIKNDEN